MRYNNPAAISDSPGFFFSLCFLRNLSQLFYDRAAYLLRKSSLCSPAPSPCPQPPQPWSQLHSLKSRQSFNNQPAKSGQYWAAVCGCSCTCLHPQTRPCNSSLVPENDSVWKLNAAGTEAGLWSGLGWKSSACPGETHFVYDWLSVLLLVMWGKK